MKRTTLVTRYNTARTKHINICKRLFARYKNGNWKLKEGKVRDKLKEREQKQWNILEKALQNVLDYDEKQKA